MHRHTEERIMIQSTAPAATRLCTTCWQERPITQFRRRHRGSDARHRQCRFCYNEYMRRYRTGRRRKEIAKFAREVNRNPFRPRAVTALCNLMFRRFGGVEGFVEEWTAAFDAARAARPASRMLLDCYRAFFRLMEVAQQEAKQATGFEDWSDEDLERAVLDYLKRAIKELDEEEAAIAR